MNTIVKVFKVQIVFGLLSLAFGDDCGCEGGGSNTVVDTFNKFCQLSGDWYNCKNLVLSDSETNYIQTTDFTISNALYVYIDSSTLNMVNGNFFGKFPNVQNMTFDNCKVILDSCAQSVTTCDSPMKYLFLYNTDVNNKPNAKPFDTLKNLILIHMLNIYIENIVDSTLFTGLTNLQQLAMDYPFNDLELFESTATPTKMSETALSGLPNLIFFEILGAEFTSVSSCMFQNNQQLETIVILNSNMNTIPQNFYPKSVVWISANRLNIPTLSQNTLGDVPNLVRLYLGNDNIKTVDCGAFANYPKLQLIALPYNYITNFGMDQVGYLKNLNDLDIRMNNIPAPTGAFQTFVNNLEYFDFDPQRSTQ